MISEARTRLLRYGSHAPSGEQRCVFTLHATFLTLAVFVVAAPAGAVEVVVKNDSLAAGQPGNIQAGFVAGESAAAWLTSPCDGNIVAVQVFWRSLVGGEPDSIEDSITIFNGGTFPTPGAQLDQVVGPVLTDGVINEYRFLDDNLTIPLIVPVTNAQKFVVSFKFLNAPSPAFGPSVVTDTNGCQGGKNAIFAIPGGWLNLCALGVSGDLVIRAVVDCNPTQACCFSPAGCLNLTVADCGIAGGVPHGPGSVCGVTPCFPVGACCNPDGSCDDDVDQDDCITSGGTYQGHESVCTGVSCPAPDGACCLANQNCLGLTEAECLVIPNAAWAGALTTCPDACQAGMPVKGSDDTCVSGLNNGQPCAQHSDCPGGFCQLKNRFITAVIPTVATAHGVKATLASLDSNSVATPSNYNGTDRWVGAPSLGVSDGTSPAFSAGRLQCAFLSNNWSAVGTLHVYGDVVVPGSTYDVFTCEAEAGPCSTALRIGTAKFGDIIAPLNVTNFQDIVAVVTKFQGTQPPPAAPSKTRTKLNEPVSPGSLVNFQDIAANVAAFQGVAYKNKFPTPPATCP